MKYWLRWFCQNEEGGITVLSLFLFMIMLMAAGFAIDVNNAVQARTQLQGAADAAGHAALYWRYRNSEADSVQRGLDIAEANMPSSIFGQVLASADVEFGDWDAVNRTFTPETGNRTAVRVTTRRTGSNGVSTFLMKFVGVDSFNLNTVSVWDMEEGWCPGGEGFFAVGVIDIQSNNSYQDGFCMHSDTHVELQNGGRYEDGVVVSMPDENDLVIPSGGFDQNAGLQAALDSKHLNLNSFFSNLPTLIESYKDPQSDVNAALTETTVNSVPLNKGTLDMSLLVENAVNIVGCPNNGVLEIKSGELIQNVVIATSCKVKLGSSSALENVTLVTTNTDTKSVEAGSGFRLGASTYCNDTLGGSTIITMGSFSTSSGFESHGGNVIASGDISITAGGAGLGGVNFMAGGRIDATSGGTFGFCGNGPPKPFDIPVFKMVM